MSSPAYFNPADPTVKYNLYVSGKGKFRRLPPDYHFPTMGLTSLIVMWFCGDKSKQIFPYMQLTPGDCEGDDPKDVTSRGRRDKFLKMRQMMKLVIEAAKIEGVWEDLPLSQWTVKHANDLARSVLKYFEYSTTGHVRRNREIVWKTMLNLYRRHRNKFATAIRS